MVFVFGECTLDVERRELRRAGVVRALQPKAFTVLVHLLTQRHRAVSKDELLATCWPGEFVTQAALTRCLKVLRQAIGDDGVRQHVIKTLPDHGYRFVATVETQPTPPTPASLSSPTAAMAGVHPAARLTVPTPGVSCPQCQTLNRATRQFCAACGHALQGPCPHCGFGNDSTERFCGGCGREFAAPVPVSSGAHMGPPQAYTPAHLAQRMLATPLPPPGERKQVTVLVGEVEGLRTLRQATAPEAVDDVLNRGFALLAAEVHRVEGFISQVAGHSFTVLFGAPLACEDHVLRALHAALGIQRVFTGYAAELQQTLGVSLTLRLGVHTGPLIVNAISADLRFVYSTPEATLEVATGLQQCAAAGIIAVSATVHEAAVGFFRFTALGQYLLPESPAPVHVYTCDGVGPVTSRLACALARGQTTLQGRRRELAFLENCWTRVCRGAGQVVCLIGEAGIGKSRLAYECQQMLAEACWLTLQALPYGQAMPYHAFLPLLRTVLGVQEHADPIQQQQALRTRLAAFEPSLTAEAPLLAHLLGLPVAPEAHPPLTPEVQRRRVQQACLQVLMQQADAAPLGVLVEDGHWLDPSSQELLDLLVAALVRRRIFVLCTARPGFRHTWTDYTYFHQVAITPLAAAETDALLQDLLQPYGAAPALQAWLYARTGGNPFFVEELVRALQVHELLTVQDEVYEVAPAARMTLPASIQGLIQARLDRLPVAEKHLLQMAAVIGPEVPFPLFHAGMGGPEDALHRGLAHLQTLEFLYETRTVPVPTYTFTHALVQEAVYQALLPSTRQAYHQQIAQMLEEQFPEMVEAQPEVLAQHYTVAGRSAQAIPYWQQAGARAIERSAHVEAMSHLTKGLEGLTSLPDTPERAQQELNIQLALGPVLMATKGYTALEVEKAYARARELCQQIGETPQLFSVLQGLYGVYVVRGELRTARELGEQCLTLAQRAHNPIFLLWAHYMLGQTLCHLGEFVLARENLEQGIALYTPQKRRSRRALQDPGVACLSYMALALWPLGYPDLALKRSQEALTLAQELAHPFSLAWALNWLAWVHHYRREGQTAQERAEAGLALSSAQGFAWYVALGTILQGGALAEQGHGAAGIAQMYHGLAAYRATGAETGQPFFLTWLAAAYTQGGHIEEGLAALAEAFVRADKTGEHCYEVEQHRLKGELLLRQTIPDAHQAQACFLQALTIAHRQQAKSLELRTAMSLARLWQNQGKHKAAHDLLAPIYGWFTEGFGTPDLQEAQALLAALM